MSTLNDLVNQAAANQTPTVNVECDILIEAAEQLSAERRQQAVTACKGLLDRFTRALENSVINLRNLRATERKATDSVAAMNRALEFFVVTGNPLPFFSASKDNISATRWCLSCGIDVPPADSPEWKVPSDFVVDKK